MANKTKSIKGTQTEKNLAISYMNEAQAYARYTFYAQQADKENYFPIGRYSARRPTMSCVMPRFSSRCCKEARST